MIFVYVSGAGTDSTKTGAKMWARVKGCTENALMALPLRPYVLRPGIVQPMRGERSKTPIYRVLYSALSPLMPSLRRMLPNQITTTDEVGKAMIALAGMAFASAFWRRATSGS